MKKIYFLCFLVLFAIQNTNAQKTENYLPNSNFETWGGANSGALEKIIDQLNEDMYEGIGDMYD